MNHLSSSFCKYTLLLWCTLFYQTIISGQTFIAPVNALDETPNGWDFDEAFDFQWIEHIQAGEYELFKEFMQRTYATSYENLKELLSGEDPVAAVYVYLAMRFVYFEYMDYEWNINSIKPVEIPVKKGCTLSIMQVSDLINTLEAIYLRALPESNDTTEQNYSDELSYYPLKERVLKHRDPLSFAELAQYRRKDDIPLIMECITSDGPAYPGLRCIMLFPDPVFFPLLAGHHARFLKKQAMVDIPSLRVLYKAVVQYKNDDALHILMKGLHESHANTRPQHVQCIALALLTYPDPFFQSVFDAIDPAIITLAIGNGFDDGIQVR